MRSVNSNKKIISCKYVRFSELLHFHNHQNKHVLGHFQYYDLH